VARVFNFYAGPATLPLAVLERVERDLIDYQGKGLSLIETSHRSPEYDSVHNRAVGLIRDLLRVPEGYTVLLLGGGATLQFGMVPMNLVGFQPAADTRIDLTISGSWAKKARADAEKFAPVNVVFDGTEGGFTTLPDPTTVKASAGCAYLHITSNETIEGIQWKDFPSVDVPVAADMSSDILSRPVPIERFGVIYAGAQKNLGPAGVTVVIIRDDLVSRADDLVPAYLSYKTHADKNSLYNTPPVFAIWVLSLVLEWVAGLGGVEVIAETNRRKAAKLYDAIDGSNGFYRCPAGPEVRSEMNVVFRLPDENLEAEFVARATEMGMVGLKGHRSIGGIRASIYNAMPEEGVDALVDFMHRFAQRP
jgi:phosphoserine aminotransferase